LIISTQRHQIVVVVVKCAAHAVQHTFRELILRDELVEFHALPELGQVFLLHELIDLRLQLLEQILVDLVDRLHALQCPVEFVSVEDDVRNVREILFQSKDDSLKNGSFVEGGMGALASSSGTIK
jgi:hypothetical protein